LEVAEIASKIFGVSSTMPAIEAPPIFDSLIEAGLEVAKQSLSRGDSFAVRTRRVGSHPFTSRDVEVELGRRILESFKDLELHVDLTSPVKTISVEIRGEGAYIYHKAFQGPGGLPYGSQGRLIGLLSGGIDSPVAIWMMMKRGADVIPLFLDQRPFVGDNYYDRVLSVARKLREYVPRRRFHLRVAPTGELMKAIVERSPPRLICVLCKRAMYRIGCVLAQDLKAEGIVTGENLGQVASQTLHNLRTIDSACSLPVYRPLIGFEKNQTVETAKRIGTLELSTESVQGCTAVPAKPATKSRVQEVLQVEKDIGMVEMVRAAVAESYAVTL